MYHGNHHSTRNGDSVFFLLFYAYFGFTYLRWELMDSMSYRWPISAFPAFRILQTKSLQKEKINEQICLVRSVSHIAKFFFFLNLKVLMMFFL